MRFTRTPIIAFLLACLALPVVAGAQGGYQTDTTREQFVAAADPKCERANDKTARQFKPVRKLVRKGRYKAAGEKLIRGEKFQLELYGRLAKLDRPPADAKTIGRWLRTLEDGSRTWIKAAQELKKKRFRAADAGLEEADAIFRKARKKVKGFGFSFCA